MKNLREQITMSKVLALLLVVTITIPMTIFKLASTSASAQSSQEVQLLNSIAKARGIPAQNLILLTSSTVNLPLTHKAVRAAKVKRLDKNERFSVALDQEDKEVNLVALRKAEQQAYDQKYGKLDPVLYELVLGKQPQDKIKIAFWLKLERDVLDDKGMKVGPLQMSASETKTVIKARQEQLSKAVSVVTRAFGSKIRRTGVQVDEVSLLSPIVYVTTSVGLLTSLADHDEVVRIYSAESIDGDDMDVAAGAIRADDIWNSGFNGSGVTVAIVEGGRVDFDNNCLGLNGGTRSTSDSTVSQHATAVAGMVASTNTTIRGIASGASIYSANGSDDYNSSKMTKALDAGATNAEILNNSWGAKTCKGANSSMSAHARQADYIVRYVWDTVVASSGNKGNCTDGGFVGGSGVKAGHNVITVGNYNDKGTTDWDDDTMSSSSSYKNPSSDFGDREKPDVAAPGTSISSLLLASPGTCPTGNVGNGTSYSSPMVAGTAALLLEADYALSVYPETVKALIMAGARNNIEGSASLSDRDGAGGIDAYESYCSLFLNRYRWFDVTSRSFDSNGDINVDMGYVQAGRRVKVALVWLSNPSSDYKDDVLEADLDLYVVGPNSEHVSCSFDNSAEVVDFTATKSGNYKIKINNWRFDGVSEYVAVAWSY